MTPLPSGVIGYKRVCFLPQKGELPVMSRGWSVVVPEGYVVSRWRVGAPIASGSWASVYEARLAEPEDAPRGRPLGPELVAVKFLPTGR